MSEPGKGKVQEGDNQGWQTPGIILRRVRRERRLDAEEVCVKLGLTQRVLKALESDDYEKLPATVYVRGYIRRYCELLDIRAEPVLECFESYGSDLAREAAAGGNNSGSRPAAAGKFFLVVTIPLVLLAMLFWAGGGLGKESAFMTVASKLQEPVLENATEVQPGSPSESAPLAGTAAPQSPDSEAAVGVDVQLMLQFSHDSWVEVTDSTGRELVVDLQKAGTELALSGNEPFVIDLGYGPGVIVRHWGRLIAVDSDPQTFAAKLQVGE